MCIGGGGLGDGECVLLWASMTRDMLSRARPCTVRAPEAQQIPAALEQEAEQQRRKIVLCVHPIPKYSISEPWPAERGTETSPKVEWMLLLLPKEIKGRGPSAEDACKQRLVACSRKGTGLGPGAGLGLQPAVSELTLGGQESQEPHRTHTHGSRGTQQADPPQGAGLDFRTNHTFSVATNAGECPPLL